MFSSPSQDTVASQSQPIQADQIKGLFALLSKEIHPFPPTNQTRVCEFRDCRQQTVSSHSLFALIECLYDAIDYDDSVDVSIYGKGSQFKSWLVGRHEPLADFDFVLVLRDLAKLQNNPQDNPQENPQDNVKERSSNIVQRTASHLKCRLLTHYFKADSAPIQVMGVENQNMKVIKVGRIIDLVLVADPQDEHFVSAMDFKVFMPRLGMRGGLAFGGVEAGAVQERLRQVAFIPYDKVPFSRCRDLIERNHMTRTQDQGRYERLNDNVVIKYFLHKGLGGSADAGMTCALFERLQGRHRDMVESSSGAWYSVLEKTSFNLIRAIKADKYAPYAIEIFATAALESALYLKPDTAAMFVRGLTEKLSCEPALCDKVCRHKVDDGVFRELFKSYLGEQSELSGMLKSVQHVLSEKPLSEKSMLESLHVLEDSVAQLHDRYEQLSAHYVVVVKVIGRLFSQTPPSFEKLVSKNQFYEWLTPPGEPLITEELIAKKRADSLGCIDDKNQWHQLLDRTQDLLPVLLSFNDVEDRVEERINVSRIKEAIQPMATDGRLFQSSIYQQTSARVFNEIYAAISDLLETIHESIAESQSNAQKFIEFLDESEPTQWLRPRSLDAAVREGLREQKNKRVVLDAKMESVKSRIGTQRLAHEFVMPHKHRQLLASLNQLLSALKAFEVSKSRLKKNGDDCIKQYNHRVLKAKIHSWVNARSLGVMAIALLLPVLAQKRFWGRSKNDVMSKIQKNTPLPFKQIPNFKTPNLKTPKLQASMIAADQAMPKVSQQVKKQVMTELEAVFKGERTFSIFSEELEGHRWFADFVVSLYAKYGADNTENFFFESNGKGKLAFYSPQKLMQRVLALSVNNPQLKAQLGENSNDFSLTERVREALESMLIFFEENGAANT